MNGNGWNTKEDLLKDLTSHGFRAKDIDEDFIVRGEMPPPPPRYVCDEDAEIQLRYGSLAESVDHDDAVGPDLAGITQMLRMVNDLYTPENEIENGDQLLSKQTLTISKLDPSVKEFVPKGKNPEVVKRPQNVNGLNALKKEIMKASDDKIEGKTPNNIENTLNTEERNVDDEKIRMADVLKTKIIQASKSNTSQHKRERNAAIAALIKLNSTPPDSNTPKIQSGTNSPKKTPKSDSPTSASISPKPLLLIDPQYYLSSCTKQVNDETPVEETTTLKPIKSQFEGPTSCFTKVNREHPAYDRSVVETTSHMSTKPKRCEDVIDPQIKESIDKVNNWLSSPEKPKPKPTTVCLEPITFKKKDNPSTSSSSSTVAKVEPLAAIPSFVPSQYANQLVETYKERNKIQQSLEGDIWTKLITQLKEKDELKKQKELEQSTVEDLSEILSQTQAQVSDVD